MKHVRKASHQLGIALLEVMLSISVIAIILVMATRFFYVASNNNKANTVISQIGALLASCDTWRGGSGDVTDLSIGTLAEAGLLDNFPGLHGSGSSAELKTPWGNAYALSSDGTQVQISVNLPHCGAVSQAFPGSTCRDGSFQYSFQ